MTQKKTKVVKAVALHTAWILPAALIVGETLHHFYPSQYAALCGIT